MKIILIAVSVLFTAFLSGQSIPEPTSFADRLAGYELRKTLKKSSPFAEQPWKNIGPTIFSGRVTDIAVDPEDPTHFYVAYATGGLWFTENNGTSFTPIFDQEMVITIGDIAVDWDNDIIYVGSGEVNSSRSSYSGTGIYKSEDHGETWEHLGLGESHHIGRISINPENTDDILVAVLGHLYSPNAERGLYRTTDGGQSWSRTLFINDSTGVVDLVRDPQDAQILYAASWQRMRKAWNFIESGPGSGIYKSIDAGQTWSLLSTKESGFPTGDGVGRIGLDIYNDGNESLLYVILDNYNRRKKEKEASDDLVKDDFKNMSEEEFINLSDEELNQFLRENGFPEKYTAQYVKKQVKDGIVRVRQIAEYLENANSLLFDTPVIGAEVYLSRDGGKSYSKTHSDFIDRLYNSYGYYFGQIRVSPSDANQLYILGVPILRSDDGGATWINVNGDNVHADHHALWINPERNGHIINGNDGGINISYDSGQTWIKCNSPSVGQFYTVHVDHADPYHVYGGLQDNGVWEGTTDYSASTRWHSSGDYPYDWIMGGDGMMIQVDPRDNETVYTGYQYGNYFRLNKKTGEREYITPRHELGDRPYRWNWLSPVHLSIHNPDIFYMGSNFLLRSMDRGATFEKISPDLTAGGKKGDVPYGTLSSIDESPLEFGLLYAGSDDGLVHVSQDAGHSWQAINTGLPANLWVSRIQASQHEKSRVYLSLNGYRWDNFQPYVYLSEDYGQNWTSISSNLPTEPVNVIREDPKNPDILYVGTDHNVYVSVDRGQSWEIMGAAIPDVPVHDIAIQQREAELILGTHGRSFYKTNLNTVRGWAEMEEDLLKVLARKAVPYKARWGQKATIYSEVNKPDYRIQILSATDQKAEIEINQVIGDQKIQLYRKELPLRRGLTIFNYDMTVDRKSAKSWNKMLEREDLSPSEMKDDGNYYLVPGEYQLKVSSNGESQSMNFNISVK